MLESQRSTPWVACGNSTKCWYVPWNKSFMATASYHVCGWIQPALQHQHRCVGHSHPIIELRIVVHRPIMGQRKLARTVVLCHVRILVQVYEVLLEVDTFKVGMCPHL